jgi:hypothetical protein
MADSPSRPERGLGPISEPVIIRRPLVPPRRGSITEEEAFPVTAADIQAPRLPPDVSRQDVAIQDAPTPKRRYNVTAIVFVVVAAVGTLAAVRLYVAATHDTPGIQE